MTYFVDAEGNYYEGQNKGRDLEVEQRPSPYHVWNFESSEWILDQEAYDAAYLREFDIAIEKHLDAGAQDAGYYDPLDRIPPIDRACSYAGYTNPYQAESQSFVVWRAAVWAYVYQVKTQVEAQQRSAPTIEELIQELPVRAVPA